MFPDSEIGLLRQSRKASTSRLLLQRFRLGRSARRLNFDPLLSHQRRQKSHAEQGYF